MVDLTGLHKHFILEHIKAGDTVADFTMGNGNDTLFLSKAVGESGKVYAFDIQEQALISTEKLLSENGAPKNYELILASHHRAKEFIKTPIKAGMFNLGYLPGSDKKVTTMRTTTLPAIEAAIELMDRDAIILVAVYPGHAEGDAEGKMICEYLSGLSRYKVCATRINILNSPTSPFFIIIENKP